MTLSVRRPGLRLSLTKLVVCSGTFAALLFGTAQPGRAFTVTYNGLVSTLNTGSIVLSNPSDIAVDPSGVVYIADTSNNQIVELATDGSSSVLNITGLSPALLSPIGLALDGANNLYIADSGHSRIVEVSPSGSGSTLSTSSVTLSSPNGVVVDLSGNVYIADTGHNQIVKVTSAGVASVFFSATTSISSATLSGPTGLTVDASGNVYVADSGNNRLVEITSASAGSVVDTSALSSPLSNPTDVAIDFAGNLFIADKGNNRVVEIPLGLPAIAYTTGTVTFTSPTGVATDGAGAVYITDTTGNQVDTVAKTTVGFGHIPMGATSGTVLTLPFYVDVNTGLGSIKVLTSGAANLDFTLGSGSTCAAGTTNTNCTVDIQFLPTAPGLRHGSLVIYDNSVPNLPLLTIPLYGFVDGPMAALSPNTANVINIGTGDLALPFQIALDGEGNMYVGNYSDHNVVKVPAGGGSSSIVSTGSISLQDVTGVAVDSAGDLFLSDHLNDRIVVVTADGIPSVLTINGISPLDEPTGLAIDKNDNLYISDWQNGRIVKVTALSLATTTSGSSSGNGSVLSTGSFTLSTGADTGVAVDSQETVYIADRSNSRVLKVTAGGTASVVTAMGVSAFSNTQGVGVDSMDNLYIADSGNNRIVQVTKAGVASVIATPGLPSPTTLAAPFSVTVDPNGNVLIPDWTNNRLVAVNIAGAVMAFPDTNVGASSTAQTATVTNLGNESLVFAANPTYTASFSNNGADTNPCTSSTPVTAGAACNVSVVFSPQTAGSLSTGITLTDNALNVANNTQQVSVSGTGIQLDTTAVAASATPSTVLLTQSVHLLATVTDMTTPSNIPAGTVTFSDLVGTTATSLNGGAPVTLDNTGKAALSGVVLAGAGVHTITMSFTPGTGYLSSSHTTTVTVQQATTTITGPATTVQVIHGATGSIPVTLSGATGVAVPTGSISYTVKDSTSTTIGSGTAALTAGTSTSTASIAVPNTLASGSYTVSVGYSGNTLYAGATAITVHLTVGQVTPTVTFATPSAITYGKALGSILSATATFHSNPVAGSMAYTATPTGSSASPVTATSVLGAGTYTLTATFTPTDAVTYSQASTTVSLTVGKSTPVIALGASAASSLVQSSVTFSATVSTTAGGTPTGAVTFSDGTTSLGTGTLASGVATFTTSALAVGVHSITAVYVGDANFSTVTSASVSLTVGKSSAAIALITSAASTLLQSSVTFTATVSATAGATPTGSVTFFDGTTSLGTGTLASGVASFATSALAVGVHSITAVYGGDGNLSTVTSAALAETVLDFNLAVATGAGSVTSVNAVPGGTANYALTITPAGLTTFVDAVTLTASGGPAGSTYTLTPSTIAAGASATNVTLAVQLPTASQAQNELLRWGGAAGTIALSMLLWPFSRRMRRSAHKLSGACMMGLVVIIGLGAMAALTGCGSSTGFSGQQPHTYTITVTGTSGSISHSTNLTLTVQ